MSPLLKIKRIYSFLFVQVASVVDSGTTFQCTNEKLDECKGNWVHHISGMNRRKLPRGNVQCRPFGGRNIDNSGGKRTSYCATANTKITIMCIVTICNLYNALFLP
jgi:hypothetical protein